jgi:hypothetical protein
MQNNSITFQGSTYVTDTYIKALDATTNKNGLGLWQGERNDQVGSQQRILIKVDLSSIPAGSTIVSAVLSFYLVGDFSSNARTVSCFRSLRAWNVSQATWNVYTTGNSWGTAGAGNTTTDREATDIGNASFSASETLNAFKSITLTASKIQEMITNGSFTNNGFIIITATESDDAYQIEDTELTNTATAANAPKLVVTYTPPATLGISGVG